MSKNLYLDLHIIQTVPPSCVNRDDTGSPKTAVYGGTMRARVSSQSWKHAMRKMFSELFADEYTGYRTKNTVKLVAEKIQQKNPETDAGSAEKMASDVLEIAGVKSESGKKDVLFFVSNRQVEQVAELAEKYCALTTEEKKDQKKEFKTKVDTALKEGPSIDILLFGRMAASNSSLNYDAAAQVAHSISTHTISNEYDYFTAVDDFGDDDNTGAGHLGTVEFNSSTLYRYATVNIRALAENLTKQELVVALKGFTEAFIKSMPTGKQNTFANRTLPNLVYVTVRDDQPVNLAGAFERPVASGSEGYVQRSVEALFEYAVGIYENYATFPINSWFIGEEIKDQDDGTASLAECVKKVTFKELLNDIETAVNQCIADGE